MSETAPEQHRPFDLIRYFLVAGLVTILATTIAIALIVPRAITRNAVVQEQDAALRLADHLNMQLHRDFLVPRLGEQIYDPRMLESMRGNRELEAFLRERIEGLGIGQFEVYALSGTELFSTGDTHVGPAEEHSHGFEVGRGGAVHAELVYDAPVANFLSTPTTLQVFTPIRSDPDDAQSPVIGVFEISIDLAATLAERTASAGLQAALAAIGLLSLTFGALFVIVLRASREITSQHQALIERGTDLLRLSEENAQLASMTSTARRREQGTLLRLSRALLQADDPRAVFRLAAQAAADLTASDSASVWEPAGSDGSVRMAAAHGWPGARPAEVTGTAASLPALVIQRQQPLDSAANPGSLSPAISALPNAPGYGGALGAPIARDKQQFGALVVFRRQPAPFGVDDRRLLVLAASLAAERLEQMHLYQAVLDRERFAGSLARLGVVINSVLNLNTVLESVCREALDAFGVTTAVIWRVDGDELVCVAASGPASAHLHNLHQRVDDDELLAARVIRERRAIFVNHAHASAGVKVQLIQLTAARAVLAVPFYQGRQILGTMALLDSTRDDRFGLEDLTRATAFAQQAAVAIYNAQLYEDAQQQSAALRQALGELSDTYNMTLVALSRALDARDRETEGHSLRVTAFAIELAEQLRYPTAQMAALEHGSLLHDIGKIGIPDAILRKPGALNAEEWEIIRTHPRLGEKLLTGIPFLADALEVVLAHQERYDGTGYPRQLRGDDIPRGARIFAVADAFDAMTSDRPYRQARPYEAARAEIAACRGSQFDPQVVDAFMAVPPERWEELRADVARATTQRGDLQPQS